MHDRIKDTRIAKSMSLQALADKSGISKAHIWELERGDKRNPTLDTILKLSDSLNVSLSWLVSGTAWQDSPRDLLIQRYEKMDAKYQRRLCRIAEIFLEDEDV